MGELSKVAGSASVLGHLLHALRRVLLGLQLRPKGLQFIFQGDDQLRFAVQDLLEPPRVCVDVVVHDL